MSIYDYVIVGAGSAGCVLAARLSEDPANRVLLLEAGPSDDVDEIRVPAYMPTLFHGLRDWDFLTVPQEMAADRKVAWPSGRTLGGTSSTNAMIYIHGSPADFDTWRDTYGCAGWGHADLLPYFERARASMGVEELRQKHRLTRAWVQAAQRYGLAANDDFNAGEQDGVGFYRVTQRRGRRWSAADAYLGPAEGRSNLTVMTGALATRLVIERGRATGVRYLHDGAQGLAQARGEVILAAGAVKSPQLLLLSGIGPAEHLRERGIDVVANVALVGSGLQDHPRCTALWRALPSRRFGGLDRLRWRLFGNGPLASNGGEAGGFVRTRQGLSAPDLQYHVCPPSVLDRDAAPTVAVLVTAVEVHSRGRVWLRNTDPTAAPAIDPGYLTDDADLAVLASGMRQAREIAARSPFAELTGGEIAPGAQIDDDEQLNTWIRHNVVTMHHPTSTCAMGGGPDAVCDPSLRVRGVDRLRVVDASVMPTVPRGNTNAPTIALAERAADLIRSER